MSDIDFDTLEKAMKLMTKYKVKELILSNGTKLVKEIHEVTIPRKKRVKQSANAALMGPPLDPQNIPDEVKYAASGPPKNDFNRYKVSNVLPERDS